MAFCQHKGENIMSFQYEKLLPTPQEILAQYPLKAELAAVKAQRDHEIADVITGKSDKFLVIIGPCSADNEESVCEYIRKLSKVNEQVKDKLILIPRIYTNKPRTTVKATRVLPASRIQTRQKTLWQV